MVQIPLLHTIASQDASFQAQQEELDEDFGNQMGKLEDHNLTSGEYEPQARNLRKQKQLSDQALLIKWVESKL